MEFTGFISRVRRSVKDPCSGTATSSLFTYQLYHAGTEDRALPGTLRDVGADVSPSFFHVFSGGDIFGDGPGGGLALTRRSDPVALTERLHYRRTVPYSRSHTFAHCLKRALTWIHLGSGGATSASGRDPKRVPILISWLTAAGGHRTTEK